MLNFLPIISYVDILFNCFDYLLDSNIKVSSDLSSAYGSVLTMFTLPQTDDVSINDLLTGNEPHLVKLAEIIREHYT